jgi:Respiratory-chain NADH dehydrogenase, 30 Kd subunit
MRSLPLLSLKTVEDALRGASGRSAEAGGEVWRCPDELFGACARLIQEGEGRLLSLSAICDEGGELLLTYTFETCAASMFTICVATQQGSIESLFSRFVVADFLEREVNLLFGVKFVGHPNLPAAWRGVIASDKEKPA